MIKRFYTIFCLLIFAILLNSCKTAELGFRVVDISGMIYDFSNRPVPHCEISLGRRYRSSTDINGRFTLPNVAIGTYSITAYKDGFETYSENITINSSGQIIYIRIPSQIQLLNMVDEALTANNLSLAGEIADRAYQIDINNTEALFYYATVKFRLQEYGEAVNYLEAARNLGSRDLYIDRFLTILKELL